MKNRTIYYLIFSSFIFFKYEYFPLLAALIVIYIEISKNNILINLNTLFFKLATSIFYLSKLIFALDENIFRYWEKLTLKGLYIELPFVDMQQALFQLKCNSVNNNFTYEPFYRNENSWFPLLECINNPISHGPLAEIISFNISNIKNVTFILALILILIFLKIYFLELDNAKKEYKYLIFFLSLSPPFNFLIDRLNIDLIILLAIYFLFKNYYQFTSLKLFFLLIMSLYKLHPIFIIIGLCFYFAVNKDLKNTILHLSALILFLIVFIPWYLGSSQDIPIFSNQGMTYGVLSDSIYLDKIIVSDFAQLNYLITYSLLVFLIFVVSIYFYNKLNKDNSKTNSNIFIFVLITWYLGTSLYANNDYRIAFLILAANWIFSLNNTSYKFSFVFLMLLNPLPIIKNNHLFAMDSYNYLDLNFYFFTSFTLAYLIKIFITKLKVQRV